MDSDKRHPLKYMGARDVFPIHRAYIIYGLIHLVCIVYQYWLYLLDILRFASGLCIVPFEGSS